MERYTTVTGAFVDSAGEPLKPLDELSAVVALAAGKVKHEYQRDEQAARRRERLLAIGGAVAIVALVSGLLWVLQRNAAAYLPGISLWLVGLLLAAVLGGAFWFWLRRRGQQWRAQHETAAVTRIGRLFWPVGVLPVAADRSVIWDPLVDESARLEVIDLPEDFGEAEEEALQGELPLDQALDTLLDFRSELDEMQPAPVLWPGIRPDDQAGTLGREVAALMAQMRPLHPDELQAAVPLGSADFLLAWPQVERAGENLRFFYDQIELWRQRVEGYQARAERLMERVRELLIDHRWQVAREIEGARASSFQPATALAAFGDTPLPTRPDEAIALTAAGSIEAIRGSLSALQVALQPLDAAIAEAMSRFERQEAADLREVEARFAPEWRLLDDERQRLSALDSEILALAKVLDEQQTEIRTLGERIRSEFATTVAQVPLGSAQEQLNDLQTQLLGACSVVAEVSHKLELAAVEKTLGQVDKVVGVAQGEWRTLAEQMPRQSSQVLKEVEDVLRQLTRLSEGAQPDERVAVARLQESVKEVERVARVIVSWSASRDNPVSPVEDYAKELHQHLVALREQRRKLEMASEVMTALSTPGTGPDVNLLDAIARVEEALATFARLALATTGVVGDLDGAALTVKARSDEIGALGQERDRVRSAFEAKLASLRSAEEAARAEVQAFWQEQRDDLQIARARLELLADGVVERFSLPRSAPALDAVGLLSAEEPTAWLDLTVNEVGVGIDAWGEQVAGLDAPEGSKTSLDRLRADLQRAYDAIRARSFPVALPAGDMAPRLCFVPFWYVETKANASDPANPGTQVHIFPPLRLSPQSLHESSTIEALTYPELSRRLLAHLRTDISTGPLPLEALSFEPGQLSAEGRALDLASADVPLQEIATALAQHWVFFRSPDQALTMVVQNSRDQLIPEQKLIEALTRNASRRALPDRDVTPHQQLEG